MKRAVTHEEAEAIWTDEDERWETVDFGKWQSTGKGEVVETIVREIETGATWSLRVARFGSAFTDYHYDYPSQMTRVEKREVTVMRWLPWEAASVD